jgi:two-component system chemotaxis sensor kinase CheA
VVTTQRLNLITTELQAGVMKTRMQPIGNVWSKFPRVVRDLSLSVGKKVKLYMEGAETELDKTIIEAVKDPLTHLVRNAIDHGLEAPEVRAAAGKPVDGTLSLRAFHEGGHVNIEISDDGSGIDNERIKAKAISSGLISAEQAAKLSERDASALIFLPGLTTATAVTNISGRGVGMDVVKTNIEKIGGVMDIHSVRGVGTTFRIKIPLTLAIIPALIVTTADNRYLIPQVNLVELVRLEADQALSSIEKIHNAPVVRLRDRLLPLVDLADVLKTPKKSQAPSSLDDDEAEVDPRSKPVNIVVLQADDNQFGLIVDEVLDTEEIVVKPMGRQIKNIPAFAGATIMGDGRVALIIDVMGLAQESGVIAQSRDRSAGETHTTTVEELASTQPMLVLGVGSTSRAAIPLSAVDRLEEFARDIIESTGGKDVVQYRGSILPLAYVSQILNVPSSSDEVDVLEVVVHTSNGTSVGIVCDSIVDIIDESFNLQATDSRPGVTGVAVIDGRVTDVLDVDFIADSVRLSGPSRSKSYAAVAS